MSDPSDAGQRKDPHTEVIPVCDLGVQITSLQSQFDEAYARVRDRGWFILGEELDSFEREFAAYLGAATAVGVASGTDAIHLALRALEIGAGDHVLTAPNSAVPTACGIVQCGAVPSFADVDPETGLLDPESVERHLDERVRAIVVVHLYGRCAPMDPILELARSRGIPVIEDAAQAHGATDRGRRAGTIGDLAAFSFYPSKNLGALGDAGAVVALADTYDSALRRLRNYGQTDRYRHESLGFNSRLDELQAAFLRVKLPHLDRWNDRRRGLAQRYRDGLHGLPLALPEARHDSESVHHLFVIRVARRDRLRKELESRNIGTQVHYPIPIHLQRAFADLGWRPGSFPVAEARAEQVVSLPMYPEMTDEMADRVIAAVKDSLRGEDPPAPIKETSN